MGRNMFGPIRGQWDGDWDGWWGAEPPFHAPVFVLTHHAREPIEMEGGTIFHFVTHGPEAAYAQARETAGEDGVDIAGGALDCPSGARRRSDRRTHARCGPRSCSGPASGCSTESSPWVRAGRGAPLSARHAHPLPAGGVRGSSPRYSAELGERISTAITFAGEAIAIALIEMSRRAARRKTSS